jgi:localization factor PodJL
MKFGVPWSVKGIRPEARETAKEAARRSGMPLGEWLNTVIINQAAHDGIEAPMHGDDADESYGEELGSVHERLDDLSRRIDQFTRSGPAAYAPRRAREEAGQLSDLIARLDQRLDQVAGASRPMAPSGAMPTGVMPSGIDQAVAEISARQRALNGQGAPMARPVMQPQIQPHMQARVPLPSQDLSGLEEQLRHITGQIETLRRPGVEDAINALRGELGDIARTLTDAQPQRAIDTIEKQIHGLSQRIAEGKQAGVDGAQLSGIEHGLAEVRDALRGLTPAESLTGFNDAVSGLAQKIDLIVAQQDPATMQQLESAITTLRGMSTHIASNEAVGQLAAEVQTLAEKVEQIAMAGAGMDALNHLEHRISALADALNERANNGAVVPPKLEALVNSLTDKIEQVQMSRGDSVAVGHLEDRIVTLVEKLDASDSRLGHLEALERGLADLLVHIEDIRGSKSSGLRAESEPTVDALKHDIARTQDSLETVHGTLGQVVDRLAMIEQNIRGGAARAAEEEPLTLKQPVGRVAARLVADGKAAAAPQAPPPPPLPPAPTLAQPAPASVTPPRRPPAAKRAPIDPNLPPDQPLEPGSGPLHLRANPAARIAASEAALGDANPVAAPEPGAKSGFIAAARRAAQAALRDKSPRAVRAEPAFPDEIDAPPLRAKLMKRVKSLFISASVIAIVIGSMQIAGNMLHWDSRQSNLAQDTTSDAAKAVLNGDADVDADKPDTDDTAATATPPGMTPVAPPADPTAAGPAAPMNLVNPGALGTMPALSPPAASLSSDITGSISRGGAKPRAAADSLPIAIGPAGLRNAALNGNGAAAYEIGVRFAEGRGVPANPEQAARWFERAAGKNLAPAQFRLASLLEKGQGVKKDLAQARQLYLAAAAKGNGKAMHNLAVLYAEGIDGRPDYGTAAQWFLKASNMGISDSQFNLGVLAARGLGVEKSLPDSYKWFALAAAQGDKEAAKKRDEVAAHLDAKALAAAQHAVKTFTPQPQPEEATTVSAPPGGWERASVPDAVGSSSLVEAGKR